MPSERTLIYLASLPERKWSDSLLDEEIESCHYDKDGEPISFMQWVMLYHDEYKLVAQERIGEIFVSTVWLGIDHGFGFTDAPIIFETMVFHGGDWGGVEQQRYHTEHEAILGHEELCDQVRLFEDLRGE